MTRVHTYQPAADQLSFTFGGRAPVAAVASGDVLRVFTEDCFGGAVRSTTDLPSQVCTFPYLNPVSGPFFVDGAEPGDTLAIHFVSITPARRFGVSSTFPHFGALTSTHTTATLQPPLEERVWMYELDLAAGTVEYQASRGNHHVALPLNPMHGTVGVAPAAFETRSTLVPEAHGGNLDVPEVRTGATLYLGVNVDGGLFALGDGHARQGHGELTGVAVECAMNTTIAIELIKNVATPWPRLETDTTVLSIGAARPLEDAYRIASHDLVCWTAALCKLDVLDAYQLVAQAGDGLIGNVCDPNYTVTAAIDKRYLPPIDAYHGAHQRLSALATEHR